MQYESDDPRGKPNFCKSEFPVALVPREPTLKSLVKLTEKNFWAGTFSDTPDADLVALGIGNWFSNYAFIVPRYGAACLPNMANYFFGFGNGLVKK